MITHYATLVFDCDGVVLDSNKVKTEAFYQTVLPYGDAAAQAMVDYHVANGGVSRYRKFTFFLERIVPIYAKNQVPELEVLLQAYAEHVREGLLSCEVAPGLKELREQTPNARWLIVSGGDQVELRDVFKSRNISELFDGGIFGSPDTKVEILDRGLKTGVIQHPALYLGDSKYDHTAASDAGLDFLFLSGWSEVTEWKDWVTENKVAYVNSLQTLLKNSTFDWCEPL